MPDGYRDELAIFATQSMHQLYKGKAKYISVSTLALLLMAITMNAGTVGYRGFYFHRYLTADTVPLTTKPAPAENRITLPARPVAAPAKGTPERISNQGARKGGDTSLVPVTDTVHFKVSKDTLDAPVKYHADDSMVLDIPGKKIILYGKRTQVNYQDNELTSPLIEFDQRTSYVSAYLKKDSTGKVISFPTFIQGDFKTVSDSIRFNMKNGKGITKGTYTQQGEMYVYGEKIKKTEPDVFYAYKGRFTTCNLDTPHFAFVAKKIKFINKKMAFTGPVHPEVEGVPIPIVLPFGIYPLKQGRHSGILAPTFSVSQQFGLSLDGLGYYKVLNEKWDATLVGNIYSYGGWTARINPRYYKRYRYQGSFDFSYVRQKDLDNAGARGFNISWSHRADTKARPGVNFTASVNGGSSRYNALQQNNAQRNFQNLLYSSIAYSKIWRNKPYNVSINLSHNQNENTKQYSFSLPDITFNLNTIYPFRSKDAAGTLKWYENLGIGLNSNAKGATSFYDTSGGFVKNFTKNYKWAARHSIPVTLSLPPLGPLQFSPSISYEMQWIERKTQLAWNSSAKKLDTTVRNSFFLAQDIAFSIGVSTRIFGMFTFGKKSPVKAIRHELRPSLLLSYKPDISRHDWYQVQVDTTGKNFARYSYYYDNIYTGYGGGKNGSLSFSLDNVLQAKVKNRKDTAADAVKKITLLDACNIGGSYNFLLDSFRLSTFNLHVTSNLFNGKLNLNFDALLDPYLNGDDGRKIDKLVWTKRIFTLGTINSMSMTLATNFKGGDKNEKLPPNPNLINQPANGLPLNEYQQEALYIQQNPGQFANFNIPWSANVSYSFGYQRVRRSDNSGYKGVVSHYASFNGTLNLTPRWQMGASGSYNFSAKQLGLLTMYVTREMHCWQMSINVSPVGGNRYFNISISPKSSILRDLKINRTRQFYDL